MFHDGTALIDGCEMRRSSGLQKHSFQMCTVLPMRAETDRMPTAPAVRETTADSCALAVTNPNGRVGADFASPQPRESRLSQAERATP